jgi:hypothetical protein
VALLKCDLENPPKIEKQKLKQNPTSKRTDAMISLQPSAVCEK